MDFARIMGFAVDTMAVVQECYIVEILAGVKESKCTHVWSLHKRGRVLIWELGFNMGFRTPEI